MAKKYDTVVEFSEGIGRYVVTFTSGDFKSLYVVPDWAVTLYGEEPKLVDEVYEILALNYYFALRSQATPAESPSEAFASV